MKRTELAELVSNGENSGVEFKRDELRPENLAKALVGLLNLNGGHILLGVEDDGTVTGLSRPSKEVEEWVMELARSHVRPAIMPYWETVEWEPGKKVGIVSLPDDAPDRPYKMKHAPSVWVTKVRVGTTTRDATDDEEMRLYHQAGRLQYDRRPAIGSVMEDLDRRRLVNYFRDVRGQNAPEFDDEAVWERLLVNTEIMTHDRGRALPSVAGVLLFGNRPKRFLPQSGITAVAYPGKEKDYAAVERASTTELSPI